MQIPTDQIANLLENEPGYLKFKFPSEYMSTDSPKPYFLEFTQKLVLLCHKTLRAILC